MLFFLKSLVAIFTIVDPIGLVPVVLTLTANLPSQERKIVVTRAVVIAGIILAVFGVAGHLIFSSLGVSSEAFSIAGGVLLFMIAIDMLFGRQSGARETPKETRDARTRDDVSVFPLAVPLIAGPGALATVTLLVDTAQGQVFQLVGIAVATFITLIAAWIAMRVSLPIQKRVGVTGITVLSRVLGMLLAAVAAQFILNGIGTFLHQIR
jgi:multiple antibiotic resistance protein